MDPYIKGIFNQIDITTDRSPYKIFDYFTISLDKKSQFKSRTNSYVNLRKFPKWLSSSILSLNIGSEVLVIKYTENCEWVEVICIVSNKKVSGWIPFSTIENNRLIKIINSSKNVEQIKSTKNTAIHKIYRISRCARSLSQIVEQNNSGKVIKEEMRVE